MSNILSRTHVLIRQENKGLGGARNTGIREAKGDYVWFVDSDDFVTNDSLSVLLSAIEAKSPTAIVICAADVDANGDNPKQRFNFNGLTEHVSGRQMIMTSMFSYCAPCTIYRRDYLIKNDLYFKEHLFHEDNEFTPRAYYRLENICVINRPLYMVRANPDSITRSLNPKRAFDMLVVASSLYDFTMQEVQTEDKRWFYDMVCLVINTSFFNILHMDKMQLSDFKKAIKEYSYLFVCFKKSTKIKYRLQGFIYTVLPFNNVTIYKYLLRPIYHFKSARNMWNSMPFGRTSI